ncbi:MAG: thioredoxin domain-containing protein [Terriglobales bacterium]
MADETTNALAHASSAYLRSAMHQPVHWNQWGEEAFATARRENKPVLLDIGAVWCHWCHVMDRESYENAEVGRLINDNFVAVKVDRDERPDVDSRYQAAIQAISGQGGWPLTAFLTPDGRPFYGGTYFPPDDHLGRPGFKRVLQAIAQAYREKHDDVLESAQSVMSVIGAESFAGRRGQFDPAIVERILASAQSQFDHEHGGFSTAPKFPHPAVIDLLLDHYVRTGDRDARNMAVTTLDQMARGGLYDQLGGGFHRYSTDERWIVPHFEKMSYDNSELLKNYVHAYQATGITFFAEVARDIVRWMDSWLSDREHGGFFASQDADISLHDDGDYFTWTLAEAREVLTGEELEVAALHYDINEIGEMHHNHFKNVLYQRASVEEIARRLGASPERVAELLRSARRKLCDARVLRPTPYIDKTLYTGWNALCVSAYLDAARVLELDDARHFALRSLDRVLQQAWRAEGGLKHVIAYSDPAAPVADVPGTLDDYAFTTLACLDAYQTTSDMTYFNFAVRIADQMISRFHDREGGGFFDAEPQPQALGALAARRKPFQDAPTPAGNSASAIALLRLHSYTNEARYRELARGTLEVFAGVAAQFGIFAATYGIAALHYSRPHVQAVVVGSDEAAQKLYRAATAPFALNKTALCLADNEAAPQYLPPALRETIPYVPEVKEGRTVAIVCAGFTCQPPVSDPDALSRMLHDAITAPAAPSDVSAA